MSDYSSILFDADADGVATITFNRPDHFNGLNLTMATEFGDALAQVTARPDIRVLVLTGSGRAFCPGADVIGFNADGGPSPDLSPLAADI